MKLLSWPMAISFLVILMVEAVAFHRATVCRQIAWLKSSELLTRSQLSHSREYDHEEHLSCQLFVERKDDTITWRRLPHITKHSFDLKLEGKL